MALGLMDKIFNTAQNGLPSLPVLIGIILVIAFIAMLAVTISTLIAIKRAEIRAKKVIDLPPSALQNNDSSEETTDNENGSMPLPIGNRLNSFLINKGYISVHGIVRSFFKALEFMRESLGVGYKYKLPWFLMIGTSESGKSSLLSGFTHDEIFDDESEDADITWWFLRGGVILDAKGEIFLPKDNFKANEKSWKITLGMLAKYRGERPLNGIILTIPANEIYGKNKFSPEIIKQRAQFIARKLNFAQNFLGMKLPIYIVITKSDVIPGFQSFCSEIPVRNRNNMLGWSCPYSLDSVYNSKWIDEAFEDIENELNEIRMEIFSEGSISTTRDGIFVFPSELLTIKENLAVYTDSIFRAGSVEEKFYLRGIYFTGDSKMIPLLPFNGEKTDEMAIMGTPDADINEAGSLTASFRNEAFVPKKIFFFEDLILKKVFLEDGIASPMRSKMYQSNKSIFIAKISTAAFVMIGSYGLFNARDQLARSKDYLCPSLFKISSIIKNAGSLTIKNIENNGNEILSECTTQLLSMMQQLGNARFSSLFVPASWFSSINNELTETLRISYQRVVVRTIYMNLILKSRQLLTLRPGNDDISQSIGEVLNPYKSREYALLKSYVSGLIELDKNIKKFDSLRTSGDPRDLEDLADYTFKGDLPKEFLNNYDQFRKILMNTPFPPIDLSPYKKTAYETLLNLFQNYINTIFSDGKEGNIISFLNAFIDNINKQNIGKIPDCKFIHRFSEDLTAVCRELGEEGSTWLDNEDFKSDEEYDALLDNVETLFGKDVAQQLLDTTAVNFGRLKAGLEKFNNLLQNDASYASLRSAEEKQPSSHGIFMMEKSLAALCKEPYMQLPGQYKLVTDVPADKMIYWDDELIQYAYNIGKSFEQFFATSVKDFPRVMQEGIALLARANLCAVIASTVAKAQSFVDAPNALTDELTSEEILQKQVAELKGVAPKFVSLMKIMRNDFVSFVFSDLRTLLNRIGFSLLSHIDKLLENQQPYMPKNLSFSYWHGEAGTANTAYSASDNEEMATYLLLQRKNIGRLAISFAEPIVQLLNTDVIFDQNFGNHGQLTKWTRIVNSFKGLQDRDPTNSVSAVEKFILRTLNTYTLDNITDEVDPKDLNGESGDYFLNVIKQIKKGIMERAEVLIRQRNIKRYNTLREFYNKHLLNKYPFSNYDKSRRVAVDAELEAVKQFFLMYDDFGGTPEKILDQIYQLGESSKEQYEFLKKIHDMRVFFGEFIHTQYDSPKIRLEIDFNVNKRQETNTKSLMERIFKPNNDANIEFISEDKTAIWCFGDPIQMIFRWPEKEENEQPTYDETEQPVYDMNDPDLIIEKSRAIIECVGNWAVLRFLQKYRATDGSNADNLLTNQNLLNFKIPLNTGRVAKIYAAVTAGLPMKPGDASAVTLKVPAVPENMPEMSAKITALSNSPVLVEKAAATYTVSTENLEDDEAPIEDKDKEEKPIKKSADSPVQQKKAEKKTAETSERKKALEILESNEIPNEDQIVSVSEEEIG